MHSKITGAMHMKANIRWIKEVHLVIAAQQGPRSMKRHQVYAVCQYSWWWWGNGLFPGLQTLSICRKQAYYYRSTGTQCDTFLTQQILIQWKDIHGFMSHEGWRNSINLYTEISK